ncbi:MAG: hypothetical protein ACRD0G_07620 [Acidimicrobiales bacterium]
MPELLEDRLRTRLASLDAGLSLSPGDFDALPRRAARRRRTRQRAGALVVSVVVAATAAGVWAIASSDDGESRLDTAPRVETAPVTELEFRRVGDAPGTVVQRGESGFLALGEGRIWFSDDGETWTEEPVDNIDADGSDWFSGYTEGNGWRVIWGDDGWTPEQATAANLGTATIPPNPSIAWVSRDGGPWVRSALPESDGPDTGAHGGFIGTNGPVLVGHRSGADPENPNQPTLSDAIADRLSELEVEYTSLLNQGVRVLALGGDGQIAFRATLAELGIDPAAYAPPPASTLVWTTSDGAAWTLEPEPAVNGAVLGYPNPQATTQGLFATTAAADGSFGLWRSADGRSWQPLASPGYVTQVLSGPQGLFATGYRDGVPALWRSDDLGASWTELALPPVDPDAGWQPLAAAAGPLGVAAVLDRLTGFESRPCPPELQRPPGSAPQECTMQVDRHETTLVFTADGQTVTAQTLTPVAGNSRWLGGFGGFGGFAAGDDQLLLQTQQLAPGDTEPAAETWLGAPNPP